MSRIYYIKIKSPNKAKNDIDELMEMMSYTNVAISGIGKGKIETFFRKIFTSIVLIFRLHRNDILILQYPLKNFYKAYCRIAKFKKAKTITLIHDLGTFRRKKLTATQEISRLAMTDYIIAHNDEMKNWLKQHGIRCTIGCLGIFDYLSDIHNRNHIHKQPYIKIAYAGGLYKRKNSFLYKISDSLSSCHLDLFGQGDLDISQLGENIEYHGKIASDDFISNVNDDWGLVWDGDTIDNCSGTWGTYLRYNNPHKTSFYLRAGLPVIVWKESAMAPFIAKNHIGITIKSLSDLPSILKSINENEYNDILDNVIRMGTHLQNGEYFCTAINKAIEFLNKPESFKSNIESQYNTPLEMKKVWNVQLDLAIKLKNVCESHGLRFWLDGGSLLGAVRHKGFIPWDDDIDFSMMREDYDKLNKIAKKEFTYPYFWQTTYSDKDFFCGHAILRNVETTACNRQDLDKNYCLGIGIDIFVLDGVFNNPILYTIHRFITKLIKGITRGLIKAKCPQIIYKSLFKLYETMFRIKNTKNSQYIGEISWRYRHHEILKKQLYDKTVFIEFENEMFPAPFMFDKKLRDYYGHDYMIPKLLPNFHGIKYFDANTPYYKVITFIKQNPKQFSSRLKLLYDDTANQSPQ